VNQEEDDDAQRYRNENRDHAGTFDFEPLSDHNANSQSWRSEMTLCPIAIVIGCKKCPVFSVCPLKGVIGDYRKQPDTQPKQQADNTKK